MKKKPGETGAPESLAPDFIYKGAIVEALGRERTIAEVRDDGGSITLGFEGGGEMLFDAKTVREIPGRAPAFLQVGAILRVTDPQNRKHGMPPVLDWQVSSFDFIKDDEGRERLHVTLKHGKPPRFLMGRFNPRRMAPLNLFTLKETMTVPKPLKFRPK